VQTLFLPELFIRVVQQNLGTLSKTKRDSHFQWMKDEEIHRAEQAVKEAFGEIKGSPG